MLNLTNLVNHEDMTPEYLAAYNAAIAQLQEKEKNGNLNRELFYVENNGSTRLKHTYILYGDGAGYREEISRHEGEFPNQNEYYYSIKSGANGDYYITVSTNTVDALPIAITATISPEGLKDAKFIVSLNSDENVDPYETLSNIYRRITGEDIPTISVLQAKQAELKAFMVGSPRTTDITPEVR